MNFFDFQEDPSQQDHIGFLSRPPSNNNQGVKNLKGVQFKNSPERKPMTTHKATNNYQQEESEDLFSGLGGGFNYLNNMEGASMFGGSQEQISDFLFSGFGQSELSSKFMGNPGANALSFQQGQQGQQVQGNNNPLSNNLMQNVNNANIANAYTNKKKSSDIEKEMREMESLLAGKRHAPPQNPQNIQTNPQNKRNSMPNPMPMPMPQQNLTNTNTNISNQGAGNNYYNKRSRIDMSILEETEEEEERFFENKVQHTNHPNHSNLHNPNIPNQDRHFPKPNQSKNLKPKNENANIYSKNISLTNNKTSYPQPTPQNPNQLLPQQRREKDQNQFPNSHQVPQDLLIKKSKRNKKVILEENIEPAIDKELLMQEMLNKYSDLEKSILEKKEKVKRIMSISKAYERYYQKAEDFNKRLPNLVLRYLQSYQDFLLKANQLLSSESSGVDEIIQQNEVSIKEVEEKFQFFKQCNYYN
jgi:hypothetical protein